MSVLSVCIFFFFFFGAKEHKSVAPTFRTPVVGHPTDVNSMNLLHDALWQYSC